MNGEGRERWGSEWMLVLVAIGSAVGLGNFWKFPWLVAENGGGAFLIPYIVMLILVGYPLLVAEVSLGQKTQLGVVHAFQKINSRFFGIGLAAIFCGYIVVSYYNMVIGWCIHYALSSPMLAWGTDTAGYFEKIVLHQSDGPMEIGMPQVDLVLVLVAVWLIAFLSTWKSLGGLERVVKITMAVPSVFLVVLAWRGLTLPGAMVGVEYYLKPDFNALLDFKVWSAAAAQIFFTLSLAFGIMIGYASYKGTKEDISRNALIVTVANSAFSLVSGLVIFSTLGYMAQKNGVDVSTLSKSGPGLVFVVFPEALSMMPLAPLMATIFFVMLSMLGISSSVSLVKAVITTVLDQWENVEKEKVALLVCVVGFLMGIIYTTNAGVYYLDIIDHYVNQYGLILVGLLEVLVLGWWYKTEELARYMDEVSAFSVGRAWSFLVKYAIPPCLMVLLGNTLIQDISQSYSGYPLAANLLGASLAIAVVAMIVVPLRRKA